MKRFLFYLLTFLSSCQLLAQTTFTVNNNDGMPLSYQVTSTDPLEVKLTGYGTIPAGYALGTTLNVPATVTYGGNTYNVIEINQCCFQSKTEFTKVNMPEGIRTIGDYCFMESSVMEFTFPKSLNKIGIWAFLFIGRDYVGTPNELLDFSKTSIEEFPEGCLQVCTWNRLWVYNSIAFPATTKKIHEGVMGGGYLQLPNIYLNAVNPPTITVDPWGTPQKDPFSATSATNQKIYVPIDATKGYSDDTDWAKYKDKYRERITIGGNGYSTLYLANENFTVPTGCEAFVIESITQSTTAGDQDKANATKYPAGSIIPAGQAVILKGLPGQTYEYQANVSGTEVTITNNMLIGSATDQTINAPGYDYYLFGYATYGQGFYRQTGHTLASISLKAHKAGLRVPKSSSGSAKSFVINFDEAKDGTKNAAVTAIKTLATEKPETNIVYDLQGRRVQRPTKGIYIVNGKKTVFK